MTILKNIKEHWAFLIILVLGISVRLIPINQYQYSHDELSGLSRTLFANFNDEINFGVKLGDTHPALVQLFLYYWVKLFGYSEVIIKIPFLLCGVTSIFFIYKLCLCFLSKKAGLLASTLISLSFIFLVYSSYARMYITGVLFSIMLLYYLFHILFSIKVSVKHYVLFLVSCLLCAYNQHISCLFALSAALLGLYYIPKERLKMYFIICGITVLFYLPHLSVTLYQFSIGGIGTSVGGWLTKPKATELFYFLKTLFGCGLSGKCIASGFMLIMGISVFKLIPITKKQLFLFWIFLINYLIIYFYSIFQNPIYQYSVLLFCSVALILCVCSFAEFIKIKMVYALCGALIVLLGFQTVYKKQFFSKVNAQDFETEVKMAVELTHKYGKDNVTAVFKTEDFFVYLYQKKYRSHLNYVSLKNSFITNTSLYDNYLRYLKQNYIVLGNASAVDVILVKKYFPFIIKHEESYFTNVIVLSKLKNQTSDASIINYFKVLNSDLNLYINKDKNVCFAHDSLLYHVSMTDDEFPFNVNLPLNETNFKLGQSILAQISYEANSKAEIEKERLCLGISEKNKEAVFFNAINLDETYDTTKRLQTICLDYFVGSEHQKWKNQNMEMNFFIWKAQNSNYTIRDFKLLQVDYNPTKWKLWD